MPSGIIEVENKKKEIKFKGYVTAPASGVFPGILLLHQNFGVDANIRAYAESLAANNYTVFIPDLFWRDLPGCELNSSSSTDINKSMNLVKNFNIDKGFDDVTLCLKWLRETPQCNGLVTVVGFGIGANLAYLAGLWLDIEATVCYDFDGSSFFQENDTSIRRPMLIHLNHQMLQSLEKENKKKFIYNIKNINLQIYENCSPNFYRIADKNYNRNASLNSYEKTLAHIKTSFAKPHTT
jgi:carboxymethylenebutenolidase